MAAGHASPAAALCAALCAALFAALPGGSEACGQWIIEPRLADGGTVVASRAYAGETLVLETERETPTGRVLLADFLYANGNASSRALYRIVSSTRGHVAMDCRLTLRFDSPGTLVTTGTASGKIIASGRVMRPETGLNTVAANS
ncbi:hypothetical protein [Paraburkholderia kururiensis]|uniref:hypothetical protein n=1 Tax=Paraburkholderia kururiensis TaxID=984307 RepID=UPI0005AA1BE6|nr:hypothetical protein [Paraburkholderia kururiensis]